jgi:hypothetical protein
MKGERFVIILDQMACGSPSEECWSYGAFLMLTTSSQGRLGQTGTKDLKNLL